MKYIDLIEKNRILGSQLDSKKFEIHIISNIIVNELNNILEYSLRTNNINAVCVKTDYDNIIQNAETYKESSCIIILIASLIFSRQGAGVDDLTASIPIIFKEGSLYRTPSTSHALRIYLFFAVQIPLSAITSRFICIFCAYAFV